MMALAAEAAPGGEGARFNTRYLIRGEARFDPPRFNPPGPGGKARIVITTCPKHDRDVSDSTARFDVRDLAVRERP